MSQIPLFRKHINHMFHLLLTNWLRMIRDEDFKQIFYSHYSSMHKLSLNILRNDDLTQDAVQDVFTQLWKKRDQLIFTVTPEAYLKRAVVNASTNLLKKKRVVPTEHVAKAALEET